MQFSCNWPVKTTAHCAPGNLRTEATELQPAASNLVDDNLG